MNFSISPRSVEAVLDTLIQERFSIEIERIGDAAPNFELQPINLTNIWLTISGPRSIVYSVARVVAYIDVTGLYEDEERLVTLIVYDSAGEEITDSLTLSVTETTAFIRIWPVRNVEISAHWYGESSSGFAVSGLETDRDSIYIVGPAAAIEGIPGVPIDINLDGASESYILEVDITRYLPPGAFLRRDVPETVNVTVTIEPIEQVAVQVPRDDVRILGVTAVYQIIGDTTPLNVNVLGPRSLISELTPEQISLELDLRSLGVGIHTVALYVQLPPGFTLGAGRPVMQVQIHSPADLEAEQEVLPEETPETEDEENDQNEDSGNDDE
jgi:YbbR domain-containing protein